MKLIDLLKAIAANKNNITKNYGSHCIYINLPREINYIKLIDEVTKDNEETINNIVTEYEITLSELLTIRNKSFFLGSIYLVSARLSEMGSVRTEEEYRNIVKEMIKDYAELLNE